MGDPWEIDEVYQLSMDSLLSEIHGVGEVGSYTLRVFHQAGFNNIRDVWSNDGQEAAVRAAAEHLANIDGTAETGNWHALATRCVNIIRRVRLAEAHPVEPEHFICPILYTCMEDPVITRYGYSYERRAILRIINDPDPSRRLDPVARQPIDTSDLIPNRALRSAVEYFNDHYLRFSVPFRVR